MFQMIFSANSKELTQTVVRQIIKSKYDVIEYKFGKYSLDSHKAYLFFTTLQAQV